MAPIQQSGADLQNPKPLNNFRAGNPFTEQSYPTVASLSDQIKALRCPKSIQTGYNYILFSAKKENQKGEGEKSSVEQRL